VDDALEDDGADYSSFFVLCMSDAKDDLSQWRADAGGENGVALELFTPILTPTTEKGGFLMPVCYVENAQQGFAADIAKWTIDFFKHGFVGARTDRKQWADSFLLEWRGHIIWFAPILKDSAFANEHEWRLIVSLGGSDLPDVKIQQRQSLISRHLPLSFGLRVPLKSVMVGPSRNRNVSRISVGTVLEAKGYLLNTSIPPDPRQGHGDSFDGAIPDDLGVRSRDVV